MMMMIICYNIVQHPHVWSPWFGVCTSLNDCVRDGSQCGTVWTTTLSSKWTTWILPSLVRLFVFGLFGPDKQLFGFVFGISCPTVSFLASVDGVLSAIPAAFASDLAFELLSADIPPLCWLSVMVMD